MTLKDLREWVGIIPAEYDDCQLTFREIMPSTDNTDELMALDTPIVAATVDIAEREVCFYERDSFKLSGIKADNES